MAEEGELTQHRLANDSLRLERFFAKFPADTRGPRELLRHRVSLVWVCTGIKNRLLALLARRNVQPTSSKS